MAVPFSSATLCWRSSEPEQHSKDTLPKGSEPTGMPPLQEAFPTAGRVTCQSHVLPLPRSATQPRALGSTGGFNSLAALAPREGVSLLWKHSEAPQSHAWLKRAVAGCRRCQSQNCDQAQGGLKLEGFFVRDSCHVFRSRDNVCCWGLHYTWTSENASCHSVFSSLSDCLTFSIFLVSCQKCVLSLSELIAISCNENKLLLLLLAVGSCLLFPQSILHSRFPAVFHLCSRGVTLLLSADSQLSSAARSIKQ